MRLVIAFTLIAVVRAQLPFTAFKFMCSTAMVCTEEQLCDANGVIVTSPVQLTEFEALMSVPKLPCRLSNGGDGVCCRDPNYKDDWPTDFVDPGIRPRRPGSQSKDVAATRPKPSGPYLKDDAELPSRLYLPVKLPGQQFQASASSFFERRVAADEHAVTISDVHQLAAPKNNKTPSINAIENNTKRPNGLFKEMKWDTMINALEKILKMAEPSPHPKERQIVVETISKPATPEVPRNPRTTLYTGCPRRNRTAHPDKNIQYDESDFESGAGEFPWQAAVLDINGKLLCGCYFTEEDTCITSAKCVNGIHTLDLKIAVGIYDIAQPLAVKEPPSTPKPAQILSIESIESTEEIAILFIKESVILNYYTLPICVDRQHGIPFFGYDDCVVTGWGADNTYHWFDVELLSQEECSKIAGFNQTCARAHSKTNICGHIELGGGLQCRYLGDRQSRMNDIYWLKGVFQHCTPDHILVYDHLDINWFETNLMKHKPK